MNCGIAAGAARVRVVPPWTGVGVRPVGRADAAVVAVVGGWIGDGWGGVHEGAENHPGCGYGYGAFTDETRVHHLQNGTRRYAAVAAA